MLAKPGPASLDLIGHGGRALQALQISAQLQAQLGAANQQALLAQLELIGVHAARLM